MGGRGVVGPARIMAPGTRGEGVEGGGGGQGVQPRGTGECLRAAVTTGGLCGDLGGTGAAALSGLRCVVVGWDCPVGAGAFGWLSQSDPR